MGKGDGKTPKRVVELLKKEVAATSQAAVSRETGLGLATINDYLRGKGEPTLKTLEKLADYFGVSVDFLRGGDDLGLQATLKLLDIYFGFLDSLPRDSQGPAMLFSKLWFDENWYRLTMYLRATCNSESDDIFKQLEPYISNCIKIKGELRDWQIETGGLLGQWNPYDQDIFIPLDDAENSKKVITGATPSSGAWKLTKEPNKKNRNDKG